MKRHRSSSLEDFKKRKYDEYLSSDSACLGRNEEEVAGVLDKVADGKYPEEKLDSAIESFKQAEKRYKDKEHRIRQVEQDKYRYRKSLPRKDNQGNFSVHGNLDFSNSLRTPKLKRKTAWKRFYKQYPDLKGKSFVYSNTRCRGTLGMGYGKKKLKKL